MRDRSEDITKEFPALSDTAEYPAAKVEKWYERHPYLTFSAVWYPLVFLGYGVLGHHHDLNTMFLGMLFGGTVLWIPALVVVCGAVAAYQEIFKGEESLDSLPSGYWTQVVEASNPHVVDRRYNAPVGS